MSTAASLAPPTIERHPSLPEAPGPCSRWVLELLHGRPPARPFMSGVPADPLGDDDLQLALYLCYELHYAGFDAVDDRLEWDPHLLGFRRRLEEVFEDALRAATPSRWADPASRAVVDQVTGAIASAGGPSLSAFMLASGTLGHFREFAVHRSLYQRKEADPHTWALPRVRGPAKAALACIQFGEYGDGHPTDVHAELFGTTMRALGLDDTYGAYLDVVPGPTLATVNLVSMLGLHRRLRGALLGHLAVFEMTSVEPMARYSRALGRLGVDRSARRFYDAHVDADAEHAVVAARMLREATTAEPDLVDDVRFGAAAVLLLERRFTEHLLSAWQRGASSLRPGT